MKNNIFFKNLKAYYNNIYPFHMPGHKLNRKFNISKLARIDVTEVKGTDNLFKSEGIIKAAQKKAAITFGSNHTYFLVNGSTGGIIAAISSICKDNDKILISRNSHKSIYNAVIINNLKPIYLYPNIDKENLICGGISPIDIEQSIINNPDIKLVVLTSPTYEGYTSDITTIANITHRYNKILLIDEAHGAHFIFNDYFPKTALESGADIVIQSMHKTLPSFTQTAMIHVKSDKINIKDLEEKLSVFQTSSPSYIFMNSLDNCRSLLDNKGKIIFKKYVYSLNKIRDELKKMKNLILVDEEVINTNYIQDIDKSKIVIDCSKTNISGVELEYMLREKYKIQVELSSFNHIIAMTSICDTKKGYKMLKKALLQIDQNMKNSYINVEKLNNIDYKKNNICYNLKQAKSYECEEINFNKAINRVTYDFITPFPPGVPLLVPGEKITKEIINLIDIYQQNNIDLLGLEKNTNIRVIKEV